jgi:hypothetical protein
MSNIEIDNRQESEPIKEQITIPLDIADVSVLSVEVDNRGDYITPCHISRLIFVGMRKLEHEPQQDLIQRLERGAT